MRLIDADAIIEVMQKCAENPENKQALLCYRYTQRILEEAPTVEPFAPWHRVEDGLPKDGQCCLFFTIESGIPERDAWFGIYRNYWEVDINMRFDYWMPIEPPKEDA